MCPGSPQSRAESRTPCGGPSARDTEMSPSTAPPGALLFTSLGESDNSTADLPALESIK